MNTRTILIDREAYERLRIARQSPSESFSAVIMRAEWPSTPRTAGALLAALNDVPALDADTLDRLDAAQASDARPN